MTAQSNSLLDAILAPLASENHKPDHAKMKNLILYIAQKSQSDAFFGVTKLNKLLFFCDFFAFMKLGNAVTWYRYLVMPHGPVPQKINSLINEMVKDGFCSKQEEKFYGLGQKKIKHEKEADMNDFTKDEVMLIDDIILELKDKSAGEVTALSHTYPAWSAFKQGDVIPYEAIFVMNSDDLTEEDLEEAA